MLDGLDDVDWSRSSHAWGDAGNLPVLLRRIELDGEVADAAISELFNTIWHQGTVYEASALAVPFLGKLALSAELSQQTRQLVLALIFNIGRGRGYWEVHAESVVGRPISDLQEQLDAERQQVATCRASVEQVAELNLARLPQIPSPALWTATAVLVVVAGERQARFLPLPAAPDGLGLFPIAGLQLIEELVRIGEVPLDRAREVGALDADLDDYLEQAVVAGELSAIEVDSYFIDVLVERICDSSSNSGLG